MIQVSFFIEQKLREITPTVREQTEQGDQCYLEEESAREKEVERSRKSTEEKKKKVTQLYL